MYKITYMAKEIYIGGERCRYYSNGCIYVAASGKLAAMPKTLEILPIQKDLDGNLYVRHGWANKGDISIALAVITCFCPPKPLDFKKRYRINFKDGNKSNCHYFNLEWQATPYEHATSSTVKVKLLGVTLTVKNDGTVKEGNKVLRPYDSIGDSDLDLMVCIEPHVRYDEKGVRWRSIAMDDLMKDAGFIGGDDSLLSDPVILHKDNDRMNFASDNLEWVEATDPRYAEYQKKRKEEMHARNVEMNPGKPLLNDM